MSYVYGDKVRIKCGIHLSGDNKDVDAIQNAKLVGKVVNVIEHPHYPIKVDFGDAWGIYPFAEDELERVEPAPAPPDTSLAAVDVARKALEPFADAWQQFQAFIDTYDDDGERGAPSGILQWMADYCDDDLTGSNYEAAADALAQLAALEKGAGE